MFTGLTPELAMRTSTSPSFGCGSGTSSRESTSGPPNAWKRIAFIYLLLLTERPSALTERPGYSPWGRLAFQSAPLGWKLVIM